ncbi:MAG TPA: GMC family oxidoreductase [Acidimicrobiales bacterium]|jgi:choline dehydrogenase-like flavoprotein|nr:GMC family oxidoreductase [Acidimicrobiales bacterium]
MVDRYDVAVIGSGFGGSIAAFRYAAAGLRVIVLERGPAVPDAALAQSEAPDSLYRIYTRYQSVYVPATGRGGLDVLTGSVVGGGSIVYSGVSLRAPSFVFDRTEGGGRRLFPAAITRAELDPFYDLVERNLPVTQMVWRTGDPGEQWRQVPRRGSVWASAARLGGHTVLPIRQAVDDCLHCGWCNTGCQFGRKRDMTKNYLGAARRLGVEVRSGVEVDLVARVAGVWQVIGHPGPGAEGGSGQGVALLQADEVVVAAGAIGSTLLLQRSGISNPHLGRHISGNADLPLGAFMPQRTDVYQGVAMDTVSFDWLRPESTGPHAADKFIVITQHMLPLSTLIDGHGASRSGQPDAWGLTKKQRYRDFGSHFLGLAVIGLDDSEGVIDGPEVSVYQGNRLLPLRYEQSPASKAVWDRARTVCRGIVEDAGGTFVDVAREYPNPQTAHPLGGTRMAVARGDGVVDQDGRVFGQPGLSVLDGSIVPTALAVNPSLTIAALVERAMQRRLRAMGRPDAADLRPDAVLHGRAHR